jgi:hypothetical protein
VEVFLAIEHEFREIAVMYSDEGFDENSFNQTG